MDRAIKNEYRDTPGSKVLALGMVVGYGNSRKDCSCTLTVELRERNGQFTTTDHRIIKQYMELSICGAVWDRRAYDCLTCGQCADTIREHFQHDVRVQRICDVWDRWHLNGLNAGCVHQKTGDYDKEEIRNQVCPETGYRYGSAWLVEELPQDIIDEVKGWCNQ